MIPLLSKPNLELQAATPKPGAPESFVASRVVRAVRLPIPTAARGTRTR